MTLTEKMQIDETMAKSAITGKPVLHFAHANGMPSRVYQPMFDVLAQRFTIEYIPLLTVNPDYPVDNHWQKLTEQVEDSIKTVCAKHSVNKLVCVGHSLGALCTLQAIYAQPEPVAQAVLLDPPMIYGAKSAVWHTAKFADAALAKVADKLPEPVLRVLPDKSHYFMDKLSPAGVSKYRRDVWDSREQAYEQLRNKTFFKHFDERAFQGYIEYGLVDTDDGRVTLAIPKDNEVAVFRTNPSWYWLRPNKPPKVPVTLIIGEKSIFLRQQFPQKIQARLKIPFVTHAGGHMFPLEHPESVATLVLEMLDKQSAAR